MRGKLTTPRPFWVISEIYFPEETSTGYLLTRIAEGIAADRPVNVLCGQPAYSAKGTRAPQVEDRNGVHIRRCAGTTLNKNVLPLRLINAITISLSILWRVLISLKRGDQVLVVTNPPPLPFIVSFACRLKGAHFHLLIHDVYPEVLVATGLSSEQSSLVKLVRWFNNRLYRRALRVIVLGRDMEALAIGKMGEAKDRIVIIPNWADDQEITPGDRQSNALLKELGLTDKFVIQYAGNMGRTHGLEYVLAAAKVLQDDPDFHFLFIGSGAKKKFVEETVQTEQLKNVTVLGNRPRSDQQNFLNACDVSIISFVPGMAGVSVPSRMYNVMASGKPIMAVADVHSELALVVNEEKAGWVVPPNDTETLVAALRRAKDSVAERAEMSMRTRAAVESKYTLPIVIDAYNQLIIDADLAIAPK